ncbi:hypothetical protein GCM10010341_06260 [Streptomyces noursei]|nr:hypothetical protein GCM10010341_06260 [Streptomyces noursei]
MPSGLEDDMASTAVIGRLLTRLWGEPQKHITSAVHDGSRYGDGDLAVVAQPRVACSDFRYIRSIRLYPVLPFRCVAVDQEAQ